MVVFPKFTAATRIWTVSGLIVLASIAWLAWPRPINVQTAAIDRGEVRREITEEGRVRVLDIYAVASPVGGLLRRIELEAGDTVSKGDAVAFIQPADPSLLDARIAQEVAANVSAARAGVALSEADLELAKRDEARTKQLFEHGFAAQAALDRARAGLKVATAAVGQRKAELERAIAAQGKPGVRARTPATVRSPASGKVLRVLQQSETVVSPGVPLLEIGDPARIEIVAEFLSQDATLMHKGSAAFVENWGGNQPMAATVAVVEPYARTKVSALGVEEQRVNVILDLDTGTPGATAQLGHGFRVDVRVVVFRHNDAVRVPTDALVRQGDSGWAVFKVADGKARLTPVKIGEGDDRFRVLEAGLATGEEVIVFPGDALRDGDAVQAIVK